MNQRGQALIESMLVLPTCTGGIALILGGLYFYTAHHLTDHWVYQTSMCLAEDKPEQECSQDLKKHIHKLSFHNIQKLGLKRTKDQILVRLKTRSSLGFDENFEAHLTLPILPKGHF